MRRALLALGAALIILWSAGGAAALPAQDEGLIADDVAEFGVFIETGVEDVYDVTLDIDALDRAVAEVRASGQDGGLVILSADASDHASLEAFTEATFAELGRRGAAVDTLVVVTPDETWAVTGSASGSVDAALEASSAEFFAGDFADGYRAFFAVVEPADVGTTSPARSDITAEETDTDSGGGVGWFLPVLLIGGLAMIGFLFWRSRRAKQQQVELDMHTARGELREETTAASDLIWELAEKITEAPRDVQELFEEASDTFQEVGERSQTVATPQEMQELIRRLGRATWQLEVVEARIKGRPPPPEPTREQIEVPVRDDRPPPPAGRRPPPPAPVPPVLRRSRRRRKSGIWDVLGPAIGGAAAGSIFRTRNRGRSRSRARQPAPRSSRSGGLGGPVLGDGSSSPPRRKVTVEEANRGSRRSRSAPSGSRRASRSPSRRSSSGRVRSAGRMRDRVRSAGRRRSR